MPRDAIRSLCAAALLLLLGGCGVIDYLYLPPPEDTAQELFESGTEAMRDKEFSKAADFFTKLKDRYPFSPYTPQAELALGDAYFLNEDFPLSVEAYKEFESLHPRHEQIPYVLFQIGVANYKSFTSLDKPQQPVIEALEYFYRLKDAFPESPYARNAGDYIVKCRRLLAEHELLIADFYWKSERYQAAWSRYRFVAEQFSDLPDIVRYAVKRGEMAYLLFQKGESGREREKIEGTWKSLFDWL